MPDHPAPRPGRLRVFVDESGDPGTNPASSRWLVFGAVAVLPGDDSVAEAIEEVRTRLDLRGTLHFTNIRRSIQKLYAFKTLAKANFTSLVVVSDAHAWHSGSGPAQHNETHYRYALSHLIQRATVLASSLGLKLDLILEESGHTSLGSVRSHIERLSARSPDDHRRRFADWTALNPDSIWMVPKHEEPLLSAADGIAHAYYKALVVAPKLGTAEPHYADIMQPHLWSHGSPAKIAGAGFFCTPPGTERRVYRDYPYIREWVIGQKQVAPLLWQSGAQAPPNREGLKERG